MRTGRLLLGFALLTGGCGSHQPGAVVPDDAPATLTVDNQRFDDMTIYLVETGGVRQRLGIARGTTKTRLTVPVRYSQRNAIVRFVADPIGGKALPVTEDINVGPGDEVLMRIMP